MSKIHKIELSVEDQQKFVTTLRQPPAPGPVLKKLFNHNITARIATANHRMLQEAREKATHE